MKLYLDAPNGVMGQDFLAETMREILKHVPDAQLDSDAEGTFIEVPDEVGEKILNPPKKRGRPRKSEE